MEREAKAALGCLVKEGTGGNLPRYGFEYSDQIVSRMQIPGQASKSLAAWAVEFANNLE